MTSTPIKSMAVSHLVHIEESPIAVKDCKYGNNNITNNLGFHTVLYFLPYSNGFSYEFQSILSSDTESNSDDDLYL